MTNNIESKDEEAVITAFANWIEAESKNGFPPRGTMGGALVVLERLQNKFDLSINSQTAPGGSQIIGVNKSSIQRILARYNEERILVEEGRTNRGLRGAIIKMLEALEIGHLENLPESVRNRILIQMQSTMVEKIIESFNRKHLEIVFDINKSTRQTIAEILQVARNTGKGGPVAQHLVGAKLARRFPGISVGNESYSTADVQLDRAGDFEIEDTVFHVTVSPMIKVYDKCVRNLNAGLRVYLIVPDDVLIGTRQNANSYANGRIAVESIESFIAQNIEEISAFSSRKLREEFRQLLETYNQRVKEAENDHSILIDIPSTLLPSRGT